MSKARAQPRAGAAAWVAVAVAVGSVALGDAAVPAASAAAVASARGARPVFAAPVAGAASRLPDHADPHGRELPAGAAAPVSRFLGRMEPEYRVSRAGPGFVARNPGERLTAEFSSAGVVVRSGRVSVGMRLGGYGYGSHVLKAGAVAPSAAANRVSYRWGALSQWYVNGPLGLEQGFTLKAPPPGRRATGSRRLTVVLAVSGGAHMAAVHGGVLFTGSGSALAYQGLVVTDARGRRLPARVSVEHRVLLLRVDDARARYPVTVDPLFQQLAELTNASGSRSDNLGFSVAVSGDTVVAGAPSASTGLGAVYVFTEPPGGWSDSSSPVATLTNAGGTLDDQLGHSVAVSAGTVVAGATGVGNSAGAAYVFTEPAGGWATRGTPTATLTESGGAARDRLGFSVAVNGGTVVAGAYGVSNFDGAVYVFSEPDSGWATTDTPTATLTDSGATAFAGLGFSVAVDDSTVVAGAPSTNLSEPGQVDVYSEGGSSWTDSSSPTATLTNSGGSDGDELGWSVAMDENTVVAGAVGASSNAGAVDVFSAEGNSWSSSSDPTATLTDSIGSSNAPVGASVAVSGGTVLAGAPGSLLGGPRAGAVYEFTEAGSSWSDETSPAATLTASDGSSRNLFGRSVDLDGGTAAIGAAGARGRFLAGGAAYVFGVPAARPSYVLGGFSSPKRGSVWRAGSVVTVQTTVHYTGGSAIPGAVASVLGANCQMTVRASGAQQLGSHCMRYDNATEEFTYQWRLGSRRTGRVTLGVELAYPAISMMSEEITVFRGTARR